jgi:hypothetical protein
MQAEWDTDNGQQIGAAYEVEGRPSQVRVPAATERLALRVHGNDFGWLSFEAGTGPFELRVFSAEGKCVYSHSGAATVSGEQRIDLGSNLTNGVYLAVLKQAGRRTVERFTAASMNR